MILIFLREFIRIRGVVNWYITSFMGFILGVTSVTLTPYIIPFLVHVISTFCVLSFAFGINNYYDVESDRKNQKKIKINAIASGKISKKTGKIVNVIFAVVPLIICLLYSTLYGHIEVILFYILLLFWMWAYSAPPFRLKRRSPMDLIWHFFTFLFLVLWGSLISGSINLQSWLVAISIGIFSCIAQIENHIHDYESDKETGTTTFAVWVGIDRAKKASTITQITHVIFLIPLILLYSMGYPVTIIITFIGICIGIPIFIISKKISLSIKKSLIYIFLMTMSIYVSCLVYHLYFISDVPTLNLLSFLGIT